MTANAYLAFDLGAESGRAIVGRLTSDVLTVHEIHRFANTPITEHGSLRWDVPRLWTGMQQALAAVEDVGLAGIAVDTWGVDYALLGPRGELLQNPLHYRDPRNIAAMAAALDLVTKEEIYATTGVQFLAINTLNQLVAARHHTPQLLASARHFVMMPDLFNHKLTGEVCCEYTDATTTQLVNPMTRTWATRLMQRLRLPPTLPAPIVEPGTIIGPLLRGASVNPTLARTPVIATASHDTAAAVAAITARDGTAFLSSGTWSLIGMEIDAPVLTPRALQLNFSNEGGVGNTTRLLKNVMGLWLLQGCRRSWSRQGRDLTYRELVHAAAETPGFQQIINPDDPSFANPDDMLQAIDRYCSQTGQRCPDTPGGYARVIFDSLARKYRVVIRDLEELVGRPIDRIRVIGGGSQNTLLNQLTADATGLPVFAGPVEATAFGNIAVQMLATGAAASLAEARRIIDRSFPTTLFEPRDVESWDRLCLTRPL